MDYVTQCRQALIRGLKADKVDALLLTNPVSVTYLTGFTGDSSFLVVGPRAFVLVSDTRFEEQIKEECPGLEAHIRGHGTTTVAAAADVLGKAGAKAVGVEADHVTLAALAALEAAAPKATFVPLPGRVEALRVLKDPSEHDKIRTAVKVAERAFQMFRATIWEADTEKQMVDDLEHYLRKCGAKGSSFPPIVAVGDRGALPHAPPTDRPLMDGSKLLVDWGADLLYKSDLTRTFRSPYGTSLSRRNKQERAAYNFDEVFAIVCQAQDAAAAAAKPGVPAKDVDAAARKVFADAKLRDGKGNLADFFTHGLGHGIGLEVHEAPRVRSDSTDVLDVGMVITLEPGVYIPGWGGLRIEDDFLITRDGATRLTTLPRDPGSIG